MTKIKFNCPSCDAKLKVPIELAGVAGPCPQCGGTIVAPLQPQVNQAVAEPVLSGAGGGGGPVQHQPAAPEVQHQQPVPQVQQQPSVVHAPIAPPVIAQAPPVQPEPAPVIQQQPELSPVPQTQPPVSEPLPVENVFPKPFEQVNHTAAVALGHAPLPDAATTNPLPETPSPELMNLASPPTQQPEDIFSENSGLMDVGPPSGAIETQPILVKNKTAGPVIPTGETDFHSAVDAVNQPRLDATLGEMGDGLLTNELESVEPTMIQLPEVGHEDPEAFEITTPEKEPYRPPQPKALTPPGGEFDMEPELLEVDVPGFESELEFPLESEVDGNTDTGSMAALLAGGELQDPVALPEEEAAPPAKSKDEILDELLGAAPTAKPKKKKKGLLVFFLLIFGAVFICAAIGIFYVVENKLGGWNVSVEDVKGEQGLKNDDIKANNFGAKGEGKGSDSKGSEPKTPEGAPAIPGVSDELLDDIVGDVAGESGLVGQTPEPKPEPIEDPAPVVPEPEPIPEPAKGSVKPYDHPPFFAAPTAEDTPLHNTHDLVDAFLRAPDWESRLKYSYKGETLRSSMSKYYKKYPDFNFDLYRVRLFSMELDPQFAGPFWVYQVSKDDKDTSEIPLVIRTEDGNLKVDWEIFTEFHDQHFVQFRAGKLPAPKTLRVVVEHMIEYPGPDKVAFTNLADYHCYKVYPPYGGFEAFTEYAFVKKGTAVAKKLEAMLRPEDSALAVIATLDRDDFAHKIRHYVISDIVTEGWMKDK